MASDSVQKTILVALALCVVCSLVVSAFAIGLKPIQTENRIADQQRNILVAAGIYDPERSVEEQFETVDVRIVDLESGEYVEPSVVDPSTYDQRKASNDPALSVKIPPDEDLGGIKRRAKYARVYLVNNDAGEVETYVFPVNGKGLWSTLYGMLAVEADLNTVKGMIFYEHKETPGLGGEVQNPSWVAQWPGKKLFDESGGPKIEVVKGQYDRSSDNTEYKVDGLSGATITARGVTYLLRYWMGDDAFGNYIERQRGEVAEASTQGATHG